jgi:hypothetical protein
MQLSPKPSDVFNIVDGKIQIYQGEIFVFFGKNYDALQQVEKNPL